MKATGLSWCPMIPDNWEVLPAKEIFFKNKRDITDTDEVVTCFRDGEVTLRKNRRSTGYTESEEYAGFQGVRVNDLVIHQMDAFAGAIGVSDSDGMCTSVYHCCTPIGNHDVHYFKYLLRYMAFSGYIASLSKGIRERSTDFSYNVFRRQLLIIPPYDEQKKIAAYLEEKIAAINATIAARDEELKLLKKFKQSKIAEVVTHGLTPNVPTKSSPLGQIPAHWEVKRVKDVVSEMFMGTSPDYEYEEENTNYVFGQRNNQLGYIDFSGIKYAKQSFFDERPDFEFLRYGDVLLNTLGGGSVGRAGYYNLDDGKKVITDGHIMVIRCNTYNTKYMYYYLLSQKAFLENLAIGSTNQAFFNISDIRVISLPCPPIGEQSEIAHYLGNECEKIDRKCKLIDEQIKKMQLLKRALINEVVTGKRQLA